MRYSRRHSLLTSAAVAAVMSMPAAAAVSPPVLANEREKLIADDRARLHGVSIASGVLEIYVDTIRRQGRNFGVAATDMLKLRLEQFLTSRAVGQGYTSDKMDPENEMIAYQSNGDSLTLQITQPTPESEGVPGVRLDYKSGRVGNLCSYQAQYHHRHREVTYANEEAEAIGSDPIRMGAGHREVYIA